MEFAEDAHPESEATWIVVKDEMVLWTVLGDTREIWSHSRTTGDRNDLDGIGGQFSRWTAIAWGGWFREGTDSIGVGLAVDSSATAEREPGLLTSSFVQDCVKRDFCLDGILLERLLWW